MCGVPLLPVSLAGHWQQEQTAWFLRDTYDTPRPRADELSSDRIAGELLATLDPGR